MTDATTRLLHEALSLAPDERAALAAELLASLDESENDVQSAWAAEIERRSRDAAGERGEDWRVVLDDLRAGVLAR
jgi:putative addiction module component (TIGR02574 family)